MGLVTYEPLTKAIIDDMDAMAKEFIADDGYVTCEFSIQEKYLIAMHHHIYKLNRDLPTYGMWCVFMCETCIGHSSKHPYHVEIMVVDTRPQIKDNT